MNSNGSQIKPKPSHELNKSENKFNKVGLFIWCCLPRIAKMQMDEIVISYYLYHHEHNNFAS